MTTTRRDCSWELRRDGKAIVCGSGRVTVDEDALDDGVEFVVIEPRERSDISERVDSLVESAHQRLGFEKAQP